MFFSTFTYVVRVTCLYATFAKRLFYSVCVKLYRLPMYMYVFTCLIETIQGTAVHFIHIRSIHFSQILEQITLNSSFFLRIILFLFFFFFKSSTFPLNIKSNSLSLLHFRHLHPLNVVENISVDAYAFNHQFPGPPRTK